MNREVRLPDLGGGFDLSHPDPMDSSRWQLGSPPVAVLLSSAAVGGQYVAGRAAGDALFLANFEASSLPTMIIVTAIVSIALVIASSRALRHVSPTSWVPVAFGGTGVLILTDWAWGHSLRDRPRGSCICWFRGSVPCWDPDSG